MKQFRFASVVEQSGKPEVYLLLLDPKKDEHFQAALKARRVMTIQPAPGGGKTNYGTPGYSPGPRAQVLVFPRGLRLPEDAHVVGINFELLHQEQEAGKPEVRAGSENRNEEPSNPKAAVETPQARKPELKAIPSPPKVKLIPKHAKAKEVHKSPAAKKVISFAKEKAGAREDNEDVAEIKADVRKALKALEAGKQVAAFNILKGILD